MLALQLLLPNGDAGGTLRITNTGEGTPTDGTYLVQLADPSGQVLCEGRLWEFPRAQGAWALVREALVVLGEQEGWPPVIEGKARRF